MTGEHSKTSTSSMHNYGPAPNTEKRIAARYITQPCVLSFAAKMRLLYAETPSLSLSRTEVPSPSTASVTIRPYTRLGNSVFPSEMTLCAELPAGPFVGPTMSNLTGHETGPTLTRFGSARAGDLISLSTREQTIFEGVM